MEYRNAGDLAAAVRGVSRADCDATRTTAAAYFHGGQTLERLGQPEEARELYLRGDRGDDAQGRFSHAR